MNPRKRKPLPIEIIFKPSKKQKDAKLADQIVKQPKEPVLPKNLISQSDLILIKHSGGKKYLKDSKRSTQAAQKGLTCWYYGYKTLWGNVALHKNDEKKLQTLQTTNKQDLELTKMLTRREIQKAFSHFRKQFSQAEVTKRENLSKIETKTYKDTATTALEYSKNEYESYLLTKQFSQTFPVKKLCEDLENYLKNSPNGLTFEEFMVEEQYQSAVILFGVELLNSVNKLKKSHYTIDEFCVNSINNPLYHPDNKPENLTLGNKYHLWIWFISATLAPFAYGFTPTTWNQNIDFNALSEALKNGGSLAITIYSQNLENAYKVEHKDDTLVKELTSNRYEVYYPISIDSAIHSTHVIVVVGTQLFELHGRTQETVLFKDPGDESSPDAPQKIYRLLYEHFINIVVRNIPGHHFNPELERDIENEYENLNKRYGV